MKTVTPLGRNNRSSAKLYIFSHVELRGVFERGWKPLNPDAKPWRVVDQRSSGVHGVRGPQCKGVEMLEAVNKCSYKLSFSENKSKPRNSPRLRLCFSMEIPSNYYLFMKTFENSVEKCTEGDSSRLQLLIRYCTMEW